MATYTVTGEMHKKKHCVVCKQQVDFKNAGFWLDAISFLITFSGFPQLFDSEI